MAPSAAHTHNLEAEESLLGALLIRPGLIPAVGARLDEKDFYRDSHRTIFKSIIEQGEDSDPVIIAECLEKNGKLERIGGRDYIYTLMKMCPVAANAVQYADIVRARASERRTATIGHALAEGKITAAQAQEKLAKSVSVFCTPLSTPGCTEKNILKTWAEALSDSAEGREWLVDGLLPKAGLALLGGWAKEGKSTLAIHLCRAVAGGEPVLGRATPAAPVIYVNYEMPEDYRAELMAAATVPEAAYWVDRPEQILSIQTVRELIFLCTDCSPIGRTHSQTGGLLVIDSFRGAFRVADENSTEAGVKLRELQDLAVETGWLILVIHHFNRSKKEFSGTGDFYAAPDVLLKWMREKPSEPGTLKVEGRMPPIEPMAVSLSINTAKLLGDAGRVGREQELERVIECLTEEPSTATAVAKVLRLADGSARSYLAELHENGKVCRSGGGKRGSPYLYFMEREQTAEQSQETGT